MPTTVNNTVTSEAEQALGSWGIAYNKNPDGTILVPGDLDLFCKNLSKLPDLSTVSVGGDFFCHNNQLTSLENAPRSVAGSFYCDNNQITSLQHAPTFVGADFYCNNNQLTTLEHVPRTFKKLSCDFGTFHCWDDIPEPLKTSPETQARQQQEQKRQFENKIMQSTVLQETIAVKKPLILKKMRRFP